MNDGSDRGQCFSCGFLGHGVNRYRQLNRSFPYLTPGWSVELQDGEYRASKLTVDGRDSTRGKEGWFGREGQPPGPSVTITRLTQVGAVDWFGIDQKMTIMDPMDPDVQGFPVLGSLTPAEKDRRDRAVQNCAAVVDEDSEVDLLCRPEGGGSHQAPLGRLIKTPRRQMRLARNGGSTRWMMPTGRIDTGKKSSSRPMPTPAQARSEQAGRKTKSDRPGRIMPTAVAEPPLPKAGGGGDVMKISAVRPLSVEAVEFYPAPVTGEDRLAGRKTMSSGTGRSSPTKVVELPLSKAGGGGGDVHGGGGGSQAALNG